VKKPRVVALLARPAGLAVLEDCLLAHPGIELVAVATHRLRPRSEDPARSVRPEMAHFERLCEAARVPLIAADDRATATELPFLAGLPPIDLLCSVSWRFILSAAALRAPALGAINLHRGALPAYGGAEPVRRMLEDGCPDAVITAHLMVEEVDAGPTIATVQLPMNWDRRTSAAAHAELVKERLIPLYPRLMALAIAARVAAV
jgi:methionyl-tRNA formyltransferase